MNPDKSPFSAQTFGRFSTPALGNHNVYVFIQSFIEANKKTFQEKAVPQVIADMVGDIAELFECENWQSALEKKGAEVGSDAATVGIGCGVGRGGRLLKDLCRSPSAYKESLYWCLLTPYRCLEK